MLYEYYKTHSVRSVPARPKSREVYDPPRTESCNVKDLISSSDFNRPYSLPQSSGISNATVADSKPPRPAEDASSSTRPSVSSRIPTMEMNNDDEILGDESGCDSEMLNYRETNSPDAQVKRATVLMLEKKARFFEAWTDVAVQVQQSLKEITHALTTNMSGNQNGVRMPNK
ncbi:hypothetical protein OESDEN_13997 [Oesophagostomum dentatum]|uniref:Uncharacterized protein n=1 Tax=Oesophagostomum dentatum TaxID=61180 RepID=A0A0B1SLR6_OESDE|nr:hypothetical protein OESDEN_13997 [Oesophagostomum dentatum]